MKASSWLALAFYCRGVGLNIGIKAHTQNEMDNAHLDAVWT
jgi:hypothetical protein